MFSSLRIEGALPERLGLGGPKRLVLGSDLRGPANPTPLSHPVTYVVSTVPSVTLAVTTGAKRYQVVHHIVTEPAPGVHVMDL